MFFTEVRLKTRRYRGKVIGLVALYCITLFTACSQANLEAPYRGWKLWGFANKAEKRSNSFTATTPTIADTTQYSYYDEPTFQQLLKDRSLERKQSIYDPTYQENVGEVLNTLIRKQKYSIDYPLLVQNPYGTNTSSLYVYMGDSNEEVSLYYTISTENKAIPDFSETMYINHAATDAVEGQIIGLVPGQYNKLVIKLSDLSGTQLNSSAYLLYVPENEETIAPSVAVVENNTNSDSRGLFHFLSQNEEGSAYYLFYDNNGILRSQIPTNVSNLTAKVIQVDNKLFYECSDNVYALVDNFGKALEFYEYPESDKLVDYDYDEVNQKMLFLAQKEEDNEIEEIVQLDLDAKVWKTRLKLSDLLKDTQAFLLCNLQIIKGKDVIVCSKSQSSVFRINNIYTKPVIRWILGNEQQWKETKYESLLLSESGLASNEYSIDSVKYINGKGLDKGQFFLSLIDYNNPTNKSADNRSSEKSLFYKLLIDEYKNRYWNVMQLEFSPHFKNCTAFMYGNHIILGLGDEQEIIEYNEKGETLLRMRFPNKNSSYNINKDTMDRYWF